MPNTCAICGLPNEIISLYRLVDKLSGEWNLYNHEDITELIRTVVVLTESEKQELDKHCKKKYIWFVRGSYNGRVEVVIRVKE